MIHRNPSFLDKKGNLVKWSGDFITIDANQGQKTIGVVLGPGIQSLVFETNWGVVIILYLLEQKCSNSEMEWSTTPRSDKKQKLKK